MVVVSADGACSGNPGRAGWAWVRHHDGLWHRGHLPRSTNQAAELIALLQAITVHLHEPELTIRSDSAYTIGTYNSWMDTARGRGWTNSAGKPTSNKDIIGALMSARDTREHMGLPPVKLAKVKGHCGDAGNEAADSMAVAAKDDWTTTQFGLLDSPVGG